MDTLEQLIKAQRHTVPLFSQSSSWKIPKSMRALANRDTSIAYVDLSPFSLPFPFESFNDSYHALAQFLSQSPIFQIISFIGRKRARLNALSMSGNELVGIEKDRPWTNPPPRYAMLVIGTGEEPRNYAKIQFEVVRKGDKQEFEASCMYVPAVASSLFNINLEGVYPKTAAFVGVGKRYQPMKGVN